jgi:hypothetical protein
MFKLLRKKYLREIDNYFHQNYQRSAIVVPSCRFGVYIVGKTFFKPNDQVIISPVTCDTVIYALLSARVNPIFVDIDLSTGNIDTKKISKKNLKEAKGIITTNLYGTPDNIVVIKRLADKYNLIVIEDCAQVIESYIEDYKIGTVGDISLFSFKKFYDIHCGAICLKDKNMIKKIIKNVKNEIIMPSLFEEILRIVQRMMREYLMPLEKIIKKSYEKVLSLKENINSNEEIKKNKDYANKNTISIKYSSYLSETDQSYNTFPTISSLMDLEKYLNMNKEIIKRIKKRNELFISKCPLELKKNNQSINATNLVIPLFSDKRDEIRNKMLIEKGIPTFYIYNPPLNRYFDLELNLKFPNKTEKAEIWSKKILPINSIYHKEYLDVINRIYKTEPFSFQKKANENTT